MGVEISILVKFYPVETGDLPFSDRDYLGVNLGFSKGVCPLSLRERGLKRRDV
jgi:hypothetical protein